jgi:hypothetical protein
MYTLRTLSGSVPFLLFAPVLMPIFMLYLNRLQVYLRSTVKLAPSITEAASGGAITVESKTVRRSRDEEEEADKRPTGEKCASLIFAGDLFQYRNRLLRSVFPIFFVLTS